MTTEGYIVSPVSGNSEHNGICELLALADERSNNLYPDNDRSGPTLPSLLLANTRLYVIRLKGDIIGCGGYTIDRDGCAELKRLFVSSHARERGCGRAILQMIERDAAAEGAHLMRLETGGKSTEAIRLYAKSGYNVRQPFGPYALDVLSIFMERVLIR